MNSAAARTQDTRIAVIGAGIAGLTAAFRLQQAGLQPVVFEAADYAGGRIKTVRRSGYQFDVGAFIYLGSYIETVTLMKEIGLNEQLGRFDAYGAMPRDGRLHYLDLRKPIRSILGTAYLSSTAKRKAIKLFLFLARNWKDLNYHDSTRIARIDSDTVASWSQRELSQELLDYLAAVVVRGPWLTSADEASIALLLWTMKNFFKPWFYGLSGGMDALPRALAAAVDVRLHHAVQNVTDRGHSVEVTYRHGTSEVTEAFDRCLITTTADQTLAIFPQVDGVQRQFLQSVDYISSVNTHLALKTRSANPATYIMVSPREQADLCGVIVDHLKADHRVPEGRGMLTVFCRHEWCTRHLDAPSEQIVAQVLGFIRPYYGDLGDQLDEVEIGRWPRVVPIMRKGRFKAVAAYREAMDPRARVQFAGDLVPMGGVNAALVSGEQAAARLLSSLT